MSVVITDQQNRAIKAAAIWYKTWDPDFGSHFSLEGFAGSGKSTILPYIIDACGLSQNEVAFCAPTGKAAKVMTSKLGGAVASTVHSLIYTPRAMKVDQLMSQVESLKIRRSTVISNGGTKQELEEVLKMLEIASKDLDRALDKVEGPKFTLNTASRVVTSKLIVVDEASMVNEEMANDLKMFGIPVLAMGDSGQLPPIDGKHGLLRDTPDFFLSEIHRQALENPIIALATMAREGKRIKNGSYGGVVNVVDYKNDEITTDVDSNAMILCGTNKKRWKLTQRIRKAFDYGAPYPMEGEPLIVCKNFRRNDMLLYINGEIVTSAADHEHMEDGQAYFTLYFEDQEGQEQKELANQGLFEEHRFRVRNKTSAPKDVAYKSRTRHLNLDWSWAITTHKAQGSQWDDVVVHDESYMFKDQADKWLYTAITRAAETLTIVK